jgi:phospholipid/cholesterol/gamma-HCH transport system permease protein
LRFSGRIIDGALATLAFVGEFSAVLARGLVPGNWRRTMREEFVRFLYQVGVRALPAVLIAALLVAAGLVLQIIYWLEFVGQEGRIGEFLILVLVRQVAPVVSALIIIGRSGSVLVLEIGQLTIDGHMRALASHGINPTDFITIPRSFAMAVALFLLTMLFLHTTLWSGFLAASLAGMTQQPVLEFVDDVLGGMTLSDHALLVVKPLFTGYVIGYVSIWLGMRLEPGVLGARGALPKAFVISLLATSAIGALISAIL